MSPITQQTNESPFLSLSPLSSFLCERRQLVNDDLSVEEEEEGEEPWAHPLKGKSRSRHFRIPQRKFFSHDFFSFLLLLSLCQMGGRRRRKTMVKKNSFHTVFFSVGKVVSDTDAADTKTLFVLQPFVTYVVFPSGIFVPFYFIIFLVGKGACVSLLEIEPPPPGNQRAKK